jgi:bifunctional DNA-binding transcriptional regulator/antitoxin component of YhaV-PrlF toxin-antitoxin module
MTIVTVSRKGQIVIPKEVRQAQVLRRWRKLGGDRQGEHELY